MAFAGMGNGKVCLPTNGSMHRELDFRTSSESSKKSDLAPRLCVYNPKERHNFKTHGEPCVNVSLLYQLTPRSQYMISLPRSIVVLRSRAHP